MPKMPTKQFLEIADKELDPIKTVEAVINDMHDSELEQRLIDAGIAVEAGKE